MIVTGAVLAVAASLVHVFIFYLESVAWQSSRARAVFGLTEQQANDTREMAFNQGFYNLFLGLEVLVGVILLAVTAHGGAGLVLTLAGTASMFGAAAVLWLTSPDKRGAGLKQGLLPLAAFVLLAVGALT
ncbi:DUF1304 domain-containing protein [Corynebacterium kalidii]|uniref:DUF1304 domain-containing protein n=1 Tax=Corynebacterium kalidii TaxID=2931982 RepID=A0A9X2B1Q1_9CORY|nr:DUF1304 domain-containing protein [Corynebacterium kalidii]MCJ7858299.1 DUF1304 domain-containing protein [Corynebacterium kalidii]